MMSVLEGFHCIIKKFLKYIKWFEFERGKNIFSFLWVNLRPPLSYLIGIISLMLIKTGADSDYHNVRTPTLKNFVSEKLDRIRKPGNFEEVHFFPVSAPEKHLIY